MIVFIRARIQIRNSGMGGVGGKEKWKRKGKQTSLELISLNVHNCCPEISRLQSPLEESLCGFIINNPKSPLSASCPLFIAPLIIPWSPRPLSELFLIWDSSFACLCFARSSYIHRVVMYPSFPPCPTWHCDRALGTQQLDGTGCNREQLSFRVW